MHVGRFQILGLVGIGLMAIGAVLAVVLPQLSPPIDTPLGVSWALFLVGGLLFWIGVIGGIAEVVHGPGRRAGSRDSGPTPPLR